MRTNRSVLACVGVVVLSMVCAVGASGCAAHPQAAESPQETEILWDRYGIPHITAPDAPSAFYAFAWAQMQAHGNLMLRLYGQARGRGAEYWGTDYLETDKWVRQMGVPARAERWYAEQRPAYKACLDAFVRGINDYAAQHADRLDPAMTRVLPISGADVLGHVQNVVLFSFVTRRASADPVVRRWTNASGSGTATRPSAPGGSNAWAIAPRRSASGRAMLVANPHLPWSGSTLWFEAQIVTGDINASGAALVGQPVFGIAFNEYLGWTHTVNTMDGADLYELTLTGDGYKWDAGSRAFEIESQTLKVRQKDGTLVDTPFVIKRSIHGPIVAEQPGKALALRVVGLEQARGGEQYWDMMRARNLKEFQTAEARLEQPYFTTMYADGEGHIMHFFGGRTPVRPNGPYNWAEIVPGDVSTTLWTKTHPFEDLPRVIDPPSGWLQNSNDPPWTTTFPAAIAADRYPPYMAPRRMGFRPQRSARMLDEDQSLTFDEVATNVMSTRLELADRLLDDLLPLAQRRGGEAGEAAAILERWDRTADAGSRGAVLFEAWYDEVSGRATDANATAARERTPAPDVFAVKWDERHPRTTPDGLANPDAAVTALERAFARVRMDHGAADVAWGDVHRVRRDKVDLAASGGPDALGSFNVLEYRKDADGKLVATMGDSYVAIIEFGRPVRAQAVVTTGNWSQPASPHRTDQIGLYAAKQFRPVWRTRTDIEANLERRETLQRVVPAPASAPAR